MNTDGDPYVKNYHEVMSEIRNACARCGRSEQSVQLLAVAKGQSLEKIKCLASLGIRAFAENYVQEALPKLEELGHLEWHFIGHVQSNKVASLVGRFKIIHSIDREKILKEVSRQAEIKKVTQEILLEVNLANEATKSGCQESELPMLLDLAKKLPNIDCRGLMVMPPVFNDVEKVRPYFSRARELKEKYGLVHLSMGTSYDFAIAIEEGATIIRVGTRLMGSRK